MPNVLSTDINGKGVRLDKLMALKISLFSLRLSVFTVFLMWTLDKLLNPSRPKDFLPDYGAIITPLVGVAELILIILFLLGIKKTLSYGAVGVLHLLSTLATYRVFLHPFEAKVNLLYFTAWPMLAACLTLFLLREEDTWWTLKLTSKNPPKF